ncbi:MAG TPA: hypothetical protein DCZ94_20525 [Lentisphaeria bacterium]|nr:MAG: hypothetical protein A2X48_16370 [Lentisphaerae bacterium GWF2_49_21]HBC89333.1 hypothetical protein [Lentisphaeria bacterium]
MMAISKKKILLAFSAMLVLFGTAGLLFSIEDENSESKNYDGAWFLQVNSRTPEELDPEDDGTISASFKLPGTTMVYFERKRETFRPLPDDFRKDKLSMEVKAVSADGKPVNGSIFIKDKTGLWFQSRRIFSLNSGEWRKVEVDLKASTHELNPEGHTADWNCLNAAMMLTMGFNVFGQEPRNIKFSMRNLGLSGERMQPELYIANLEYQKKGQMYKMIEGSFDLSREYFNPFDAEEIKVDVQIIGPDSGEYAVPAYFTQDYVRQLHFNREMRTPAGKAHWAFRFTPTGPGTYKFRIAATDSSEPPGNEISTQYFKVEVESSKNPGFVRVCKDDPRFFELNTGEFFYPIGFNIHSVKDLRSEKELKIGYRPDRGTYSYEEYFSAMARNGVNSVEVWMAAWSFALEWTSSRTDYYGLGRYNLFNAWRLDFVLDDALKKGIYVHLVLDNHGKLSSHCDPEWDNSPYNKKIPFAVADGAMLDLPKDFFSDKEAERYYRNRNRYIAGRWGAYTNIFGVELWSEIDLITNHRDVYDNGKSIEWHKMATEHFAGLDNNRHILTTHICGDYNNSYNHRRFYDLPLLSYVVGDAYRDNTPFVDHMLKHIEKLKELKKPLLITEYGGSPHAGTFNRLEADLHAGIWSSFFCEQAGTPFLWWHDFIHDKNKYPHFRGFSLFMKGIDPRNKGFIYSQRTVSSTEGPINSSYSCLAAGNQNEYYAWVFKKTPLENYPDDPSSVEELQNHMITLKGLSATGGYKVDFYDTMSGEIIRSDKFTAVNGDLNINLPPFKIDIAMKVSPERQENGNKAPVPAAVEAK